MGRRGVAGWLAVAVVLGGLGGGVLPVAAAAVAMCNPQPEVATSFCATYDAPVASSAAGAALTTTITATNTSPQRETVKGTWFEQADIRLLSRAGASPLITPSAQLPHGLIVLGGGACSGPSFSNCGGYGTIRVDVQGTGFADGIKTGTFGIRRVTNINPPAAGLRGDYLADLEFCIPDFSICSTGTGSLQVSEAGSAVSTLSLPLRYQYTFSAFSATATADASIETVTLNIEGMADTVLVEGGEQPAPYPYRVFSVPATCGPAVSSVAFTAIDERVVNLSQQYSITGCPTASFRVTPDGYVAELNGAASAAHVTGRSIAKWLWRFGDGTSATTTTPRVRHRYATYGNHVASLAVEDTAGVRSTRVSRTVKGTTITVRFEKTAEKVRAYGAVSPNHAGKDVTVTLRKRRDGAFRAVDSASPALSSTSRYSTRFDRRSAGACRFDVAFPGDADHLGSKAAVSFKC